MPSADDIESTTDDAPAFESTLMMFTLTRLPFGSDADAADADDDDETGGESLLLFAGAFAGRSTMCNTLPLSSEYAASVSSFFSTRPTVERFQCVFKTKRFHTAEFSLSRTSENKTLVLDRHVGQLLKFLLERKHRRISTNAQRVRSATQRLHRK